MKGFLRLYEDGIEIKSKLYWGAIRDCYLNFYKDRKSHIPSSVINLENCDVKTVFNIKYQTDLIQIKTQHNQLFLLIPENLKDFEKWEKCLIELSIVNNPSNREQNYNSAPRKIRNINKNELDYRDSEIYPEKSKSMYSKPPRKSSDEYSDNIPSEYLNISEQKQRYIKQNNGQPRRVESNIRHTSIPSDNEDYYRRPSTPPKLIEKTIYKNDHKRPRGISTVKEDPMMNDDEIFETKTLDELRKKYPISDKTKRWSIAASDLVGKSNDELFIMLIQLNREKSHMDIWKETLEKQLLTIDESLENDDNVEDRVELENNREYVMDQMNEMEYMINLAHPLISFLESVVKMSDVYQGDNQTFHVVYHQHPPSGKEDFSNIEFIRHNQEREVAKLINENQNYSLGLTPSSFKESSRSLKNFGKENDPELALNLKKSQKFIDRQNELSEVLEVIDFHLTELDPIKNGLEEFFGNLNSDQAENKNKVKKNESNKSSVKNVKSQNETKMNDLTIMPRRSTRKSLKSDMIPSLSRSEKLSQQNTLTPQPLKRSSQYGFSSLKSDMRNSLPKTYKTDESINSQQYNDNFSTPIKYNSSNSLNEKNYRKNINSSKNYNDYNSESRIQNQLMDLINGDSPIPFKSQKKVSEPEPFDIGDEPLIKLNVDRYQNINRTGITKNSEPMNYSTDLRSSISNSDISVDSVLIKQRMNLNESLDNQKMWKNPGQTKNKSDIFDGHIINDTVDSEDQADNLIDNLFASPSKIEIRDRYRESPVDEYNLDPERSSRIRNQIIKESMARYSENEGGERSERESMLIRNAMLAQEASRRSRQL